MSRVVFITSNPSRRPEFQISTLGLKDNSGGLTFRKQASSAHSRDYLLQMEKTYRTLREVTSKHFRTSKILNVDKKLGIIDFEFVEGPSLEKELLSAIINNENGAAAALIKQWRQISKAISPSAKRHDHRYDKSYFGPKLFEHFSGDGCINPGLLDINFDNVIISNNKLVLIDYEWCFEHCLPTKYVVTRALVWFCKRHSGVFSVHADRLDLVSFGQDLVIPRFIFEDYLDEVSVRKVLEIEWEFLQNRITSVSRTDLAQEINKLKIADATKPLLAVEQLEATMVELEKVSKHNERVSQELTNIKKSRSYKLASSIAKLRRIV